MSRLIGIQVRDGRWFAGWHKYIWKQGKQAMFSDKARKLYDGEFDAELDFDLLKKRGYKPILCVVDGADQ